MKRLIRQLVLFEVVDFNGGLCQHIGSFKLIELCSDGKSNKWTHINHSCCLWIEIVLIEFHLRRNFHSEWYGECQITRITKIEWNSANDMAQQRSSHTKMGCRHFENSAHNDDDAIVRTPRHGMKQLINFWRKVYATESRCWRCRANAERREKEFH